MTTIKSSRAVHSTPRHGLTRLRLALYLAALVLWGLAKIASAQVTGQVVQQFFVPFPEADFKTSLQAIAAANAVSNQILTTVSIVVGTTNTIIVYDHWEDGYENDLNNPTQTSTQIWGDGNTNTSRPRLPQQHPAAGRGHYPDERGDAAAQSVGRSSTTGATASARPGR